MDFRRSLEEPAGLLVFGAVLEADSRVKLSHGKQARSFES